MNKILVAICIMTLILVILLFFLINIKKSNDYNNQINTNVVLLNNSISNNTVITNNYSYVYGEGDITHYEDKLGKVEEIEYNIVEEIKERNRYLTIKQLAKNYINLICSNDNEKILNIISPKYLKEFDIIQEKNKYNNLIKENEEKEYYINIENMFQIPISDRTTVYIVKGFISLKNKSEEYPLNIMIETDTVKLLYNIYPSKFLEANGLDNLKIGDKINFTPEDIIENEYNKFTYSTKTNEEMSKEFFEDYFELLRYHKEDAYNKLNPEYLNKRFKNKDDFYKYLEENSQMLNTAKMQEYLVISYEDYMDYICVDQYGNYYVFRQQGGTMRYTAFLDIYTKEIGMYTKEYKEADKKEKIKIQLNKLKQMVNTKDYESIYSILNENFRDNNFKNINDLEEHLKNNAYNINNIKIDDIKATNGYYVCDCTLVNMENETESKKIDIIIKLLTYSDFEISFTIK